MKKITLSALLIFSIFTVLSANPDSLVVVANNHYVNNDFQKAADTYTRIIEMGYLSPELYYNLGNAYFKMNKFAYAILYYERALLLKPNDRDIKHNLELANAYTLDRIDIVPEFFLKRWVNTLINLNSSNHWAILSIAFFLLFIALFLIYLLAAKMWVKKTSFYLLVLSFIFSSAFFYFSAQRKKMHLQNNEAVIISPSVTAKSSPTEYGTDLFILHEGTKVEVVDSVSVWREIKISNGNKAWVPASAFEKI
jgi:tetratricopeptide (TPR) repeat protein